MAIKATKRHNVNKALIIGWTCKIPNFDQLLFKYSNWQSAKEKKMKEKHCGTMKRASDTINVSRCTRPIKRHANLNCKSCLQYYKWGIKVFQSNNSTHTHKKSETFSLSLLSHWSEKELLFLNGFEIRFSIPFGPVHLVPCAIRIEFVGDMNGQWKSTSNEPKQRRKKKKV